MGSARLPVAGRGGRVLIPTVWLVLAAVVLDDCSSGREARELARLVMEAGEAGADGRREG